jgi:hypothetical protein
LVSTQTWAQNFTITSEDVDYLMNLLLEGEKPLPSRELALLLVERQLEAERSALQERFKGARVYDPALHYESGDKLVFPKMDFVTGTVTNTRTGFNPEYGEFAVIGLELNGKTREFAADLQVPHNLNQSEDSDGAIPLEPGEETFTAEQILEENEEEIIGQLEERLIETEALVRVTQQWFPVDLVMDVNVGHLNLAEAVLDMVGGGPLRTSDMLEQIGGVGNAPIELQTFSLNYALNEDDRFDEIGPAGEVLWFLTRLEPEEVRKTPAPLIYPRIEYDRGMLTEEMLALEAEIDDELSGLKPLKVREANVTLIYPHRRMGTLPLNAHARALFPTARRAPRIYVTLVDGEDGEEFNGWVVHSEGYVFGLANFYRKHKLPIGGFVQLRRGEEPGQVVVSYDGHRARTEYIPLMSARDNQIQFENTKRAIGADYDDLMVVGIEELAAIDEFVKHLQQQRKPLAAVLKMLLAALSRLTPQGTVHAKQLYSTLNVLRRCPPGAVMATLNANPDFENVGGHYWKLSEE